MGCDVALLSIVSFLMCGFCHKERGAVGCKGANYSKEEFLTTWKHHWWWRSGKRFFQKHFRLCIEGTKRSLMNLATKISTAKSIAEVQASTAFKEISRVVRLGNRLCTGSKDLIESWWMKLRMSSTGCNFKRTSLCCMFSQRYLVGQTGRFCSYYTSTLYGPAPFEDALPLSQRAWLTIILGVSNPFTMSLQANFGEMRSSPNRITVIFV